MLADAPLDRLLDQGPMTGEEARDRLMLDELGLTDVMTTTLKHHIILLKLYHKHILSAYINETPKMLSIPVHDSVIFCIIYILFQYLFLSLAFYI